MPAFTSTSTFASWGKLRSSDVVALAHPTGNEFVRALVGELERRRLLGMYATTVAVPLGAVWTRLLPGRIGAEAQRREYPVDKRRIFTRPLRETCRLAAMRLGMDRAVRHETGWASIDAVYRDLDRAVARRLPDWVRSRRITVVHAYEDGARASFGVARELGLRRVYELPIAYWETSRRLLQEEAERLPEWAPTLGGVEDSSEKLQRKTEELLLAEIVVCPSRFVAQSIPASALVGKRLVVAPFGTPPAATDRRPRTRRSGPLRVLFCGSMTQRKGLADLFAAMKLLPRQDVKLTVMGSSVRPLPFYRAQYADFTHEPPRPHGAVLDLMRDHDVLCLPSIVEGRALVMQEALSQGLPLVITENTGGADLVEDGAAGFLVPMRSPQAIAERLAFLADHRADLKEMGEAARRKAAQYTWSGYASAIIAQAA
jgi:glycosyltransferase involved in cell wall biosynthesis